MATATVMHVWETVAEASGAWVTSRMRVPGGWIYMHHERAPDSYGEAVAMSFVPYAVDLEPTKE